MRATWIADALRSEGCRVNEVAGWQERGSVAFDPRGLVVHHTASRRGRNAPSLDVCIDGRPDLPGPLCHVLIGRDGICHVIAAGKANHAGTGGWKGLSGNSSVFGIEAENDGLGEPWGPVLLTAFHRASAALARGRFAVEMICGHKEWTPRKIDPAGIDMGEFRASVARLLAPQPPEEDDMPLTREDKDWIKKLVRDELVPRIAQMEEREVQRWERLFAKLDERG